MAKVLCDALSGAFAGSFRQFLAFSLVELSESCYLVTYIGFLGPSFWDYAMISGVDVMCVSF